MSVEKLSTVSGDYLHWKDFASKTPEEQQALISMLSRAACSFDTPNSNESDFYQTNKQRFQYCIHAFSHMHQLKVEYERDVPLLTRCLNSTKHFLHIYSPATAVATCDKLEHDKLQGLMVSLLRNNDLEGIKQLCDLGFRIDKKIAVDGNKNDRRYPIEIAMDIRNEDIVNFIIEKTSTVDYLPEKGSWLLERASRHSMAKVVQNLLAKFPQSQNDKDRALFEAYSNSNDVALLSILLKHGANPNPSSFVVSPGLFAMAQNNGSIEAIELFIKFGYKPTIRDIQRATFNYNYRHDRHDEMLNPNPLSLRQQKAFKLMLDALPKETYNSHTSGFSIAAFINENMGNLNSMEMIEYFFHNPKFDPHYIEPQDLQFDWLKNYYYGFAQFFSDIVDITPSEVLTNPQIQTKLRSIALSMLDERFRVPLKIANVFSLIDCRMYPKLALQLLDNLHGHQRSSGFYDNLFATKRSLPADFIFEIDGESFECNKRLACTESEYLKTLVETESGARSICISSLGRNTSDIESIANLKRDMPKILKHITGEEDASKYPFLIDKYMLKKFSPKRIDPRSFIENDASHNIICKDGEAVGIPSTLIQFATDNVDIRRIKKSSGKVSKKVLTNIVEFLNSIDFNPDLNFLPLRYNTNMFSTTEELLDAIRWGKEAHLKPEILAFLGTEYFEHLFRQPTEIWLKDQEEIRKMGGLIVGSLHLQAEDSRIDIITKLVSPKFTPDIYGTTVMQKSWVGYDLYTPLHLANESAVALIDHFGIVTH